MILPDITLQVSADTVAWYGAIVATIAAIVSVYTVWQDRSRIILEFGRNYRRPEDWDNPMFFVSVINRGRRPVKVDKSWVKILGYAGEALLSDSLGTRLDHTLDERNPRITFWSPESTLNVSDIYCVYASDDAGKKYKKYVKNFPTFRSWYHFLFKGPKRVVA